LAGRSTLSARADSGHAWVTMKLKRALAGIIEKVVTRDAAAAN
jgi:hypothetical protein